MKIRDKALAIIYFGTNIIGLPAPLLYSNFVSLFFINKILKKQYFKITLIFVFFLLAYFGIHYYFEIDMPTYLRSLALYVLVFINVIMAHCYIKHLGAKISQVFEYIIKINFLFFIVAILMLFLDIPNNLWRYYNYSDFGSPGGVPRFQGFLYEPSYYALIFSPVFLYAFYNLLFKERTIRALNYFVLISIPMISTWSFGVLLGLVLAIVIAFTYYSLKYYKVNVYLLFALMLIPVIAIFLLIFNSEISSRVALTLSGEDLSAKGRTSNAFEIAHYLATAKNALFGIGLGQIKVFGQEYIQNYYGYQKWYRVSIPNAFAETLVIFGYFGAFVRLLIQGIIFFKSKCYNNFFSLTLFIFIFIYQFTGSFITSTAEYIIWLLAVTNIFPAFNIFNNAKTSE